MRPITVCSAVAVTLALVGSRVLAQEVIATPHPVAAAQIDASADVHAGASAADHWRYRWFDGRWWYWTPQKRWMWYSDDRQWVEFGANYYPYYPGVAVGVRPYGDVNVGVGRRVGVDVWGPHGGVRVGRLYVGW